MALSYLLFFHHLDRRDLWSSHEARAAQNAQTLLDTGQWALPRLMDGRIEMQKPPLYYWLVASVGWLQEGRADAWAVRLPAAIAALGTMLAVWLLLWRRGRPWAGLLAALMLGTMVHYTWLGRVGRIDMPLTLTVTATLAAFYLGYQTLLAGRRGVAQLWLLGSYLAAAASVLLKGPIGLVLPGLVIVAYVIIEAFLPAPKGRAWGSLRLLRDLGLWWGLPLVALLTLPWFLWANQQTQGEFFEVFFLRHNLERGLGGHEEFETHAWWFYCLRLILDLLPWSLLLPFAAYALIRGRWRDDPEARFAAVWLVVMTVFLSCMQFKRSDYLLPAYPGAALMLGCMAEGWFARARGRLLSVGRVAFAGIVLACAIGWVVYVDWLLPKGEPVREYQTFAQEVRHKAPQPRIVILFRTEAHPLVYHLGQPVDRIMEWENLDIWACQPGPVYVVMPPECAAEWPQHLEAGRLYPVLSNSDLAGGPHQEPLVLVCTRPVEP